MEQIYIDCPYCGFPNATGSPADLLEIYRQSTDRSPCLNCKAALPKRNAYVGDVSADGSQVIRISSGTDSELRDPPRS